MHYDDFVSVVSITYFDIKLACLQFIVNKLFTKGIRVQ